ncbi:hypothetical protein [Haladaptatus caseinilyticus]|nr:hypothetical protein [Haladaptatus caseinilyticus]
MEAIRSNNAAGSDSHGYTVDKANETNYSRINDEEGTLPLPTDVT